MASPSSESLMLAADLVAEMRRYAEREERPVEELAEEAIRLYLEIDIRHNALRRETRLEMQASGLDPEEFVQRIVDESRAKHRQSA